MGILKMDIRVNGVDESKVNSISRLITLLRTQRSFLK